MPITSNSQATEIGKIPSDWGISTVGAEFSVSLGKMIDAKNNSGTLKPYVGNRAVQWGRIDLEAVGTVPLSNSDLTKYKLQYDDLLVCEGGEVGRSAIWKSPLRECYYQKAIHRLRSNGKCLPKYMLGLLCLYASQRLFENYVTQTSIAHLPKESFVKLPIPLPPLPEQRAIAEALSDADAWIESLEQLIAKKRQIKLGAMQELLTGKKRLPGFEGEWENSKFNVVLRHHSGNSTLIKGKLSSKPLHGWFPGYSASGQDVWHNECEHEGDAIIVSAVGSRCGKTFIASGKWSAIANTHVIWPDLTKINLEFLQLFLNDEEFWLKSGSGQPFVLFKQSFARPIMLPDILEQRAIASTIYDMEREITTLENKLSKARQIKLGMMQELLTGKIRLVKTSEVQR